MPRTAGLVRVLFRNLLVIGWSFWQTLALTSSEIELSL